MIRRRMSGAILVVCALMLAAPAVGQTSATSNDIQRLQDEVYRASSDISRLRQTSDSQATRLQDELDELRATANATTHHSGQTTAAM